MNENNGWVKLHRYFKDWQWFHKSEMVHLFIYFLINANHQDNHYNGVLIKRGQLMTGLHRLNSDTCLSIQTLRTCLKRLKSTNEITIESTSKYSIITLCNYEAYQNNRAQTNKHSNKQVNNQLTINQQSTNNQLTTNKNGKNEKNEKNSRRASGGRFWSIAELDFSGYEKLNNLEFINVYSNWLEYKKQRNEPYTEIGVRSQLAMLNNRAREINIRHIIDAINTSMANNWRGINFVNDKFDEFKKSKQSIRSILDEAK